MAPTDTLPTGPSSPQPVATGPGAGSPQPVEVAQFLSLLDSLQIEQGISEAEANEAITSFSIVNMLLAGKGQRRVGDEQKADVLGVLTLYYGLKEDTIPSSIKSQRSLPNDFVVDQFGQRLGTNGDGRVANVLKVLRDELDTLGSDVKFVEKEAKRQFNLGGNNDVVGNTEFPRLFKRYVDIVNDPLLTLNIQFEDDNNPLIDKEKLGRAVDLLVELKGVILQVVRSLSKYGTVATRESNRDWANFERRALLVLKLIADKYRDDDDVDNQHVFAVLADLTGKDRETQIAPYAVLARQGRRLLELAMEAYRSIPAADLERMDKTHVVGLFQHSTDPKDFLTERMRTEAAVVKRYPLPAWT